MLVCPQCFNSKRLGEIIADDGEKGNCPTCKAINVSLIDASELEPHFEALIGIYEKSEFGEHYIGDDYPDSLCELIEEDWNLFSDSLGIATWESILEAILPEYDRMTAYSRNDMWYDPPRDKFRRLANQLMHRRRFFQVEEQDPYLYPYGEEEQEKIPERLNVTELLAPYLQHLLLADYPPSWYRGRNQYRRIEGPSPDPYTDKDMGAPPFDRVTRGQRANPAGIAYLYLAEDEETTIAEVRAIPEDVVCIGTFLLQPGLKLIDLTARTVADDPFLFDDSNSLRTVVEASGLVHEFDWWLSRPVRDEDHEIDYVVTQYIAEFCLDQGFDGLVFSSALASGKNLVLFDQSNASCVNVSQREVIDMKLEYQIKPVSRAKYKYHHF